MKVAIKTVRAGSYQIDAEPTDSIRIIKSKIEESHGFLAHSQKIIFSGEVLKDDDRTLESYGFSEDNFLMLIVNQKNRTSVTPTPSTPNSAFPRAVPIPNLVTAPNDTPVTSTAIAGPSSYPAVPSFIKPSPLANTSITPPVAIESLECPSTLAPDSIQPSLSAVPRDPPARIAQLVRVDSEGNKKLLATLEGSEIDVFEELEAMGFSQKATIEAYLSCDRNKEYAASYLLEHGSDAHFSDTGSSNNGAEAIRVARICGVDFKGNEKLLATLEGSEIDDFEELKAMGFSRNATVEAYLLCDRKKEFAASYLLEHGDDAHHSDAGSVNNDSQSTQLTKQCGIDPEIFRKLMATLGKPQYDEIEQLEALGFPHMVALAAYLVCNKNAEVAASFLVEHGDSLNFDTDSMPEPGPSMTSQTPMALPSTARITDDTQITSAVTLPENSTPSVPSPSAKSLGKRPERPLSPDPNLSCLDDNASKDNTSEASSAISSSQPSSPSLSLSTEVSSVSSANTPSEVTTIDDSEIEENFGSEAKAIIKRLEAMKLPREAVIEAICVCDGDEERSVQYLRDNGYDV
ncbi:rad23-like protein [Stygiomarasmius scandens]|uniref:Rad23-like protein n=1 Tax=Marasmiellus scandens TaxID=2682957 RepID=A0ABR1J774_9AGAR